MIEELARTCWLLALVAAVFVTACGDLDESSDACGDTAEEATSSQTAENGSCCSPGDPDCRAACGDGVLDRDEQCDDGNLEPGDGCDEGCRVESVAAFRVNSLALRDPHMFLLCVDGTQLVNDAFAKWIRSDEDGDGLLDLNLMMLLTSLDPAASHSPLELQAGACTAPLEGTTCMPSDVPSLVTIAENRVDGVCLSPLVDTLRPYRPAVTSPEGPCFSTPPEDLTLDVNGLPLTFADAQFGATHVTDELTGEVTALSDGLLMGFLSEADADAIRLAPELPLVGGQPFSTLLSCGIRDDRDIAPSGEMGWWFYFNFTATRVDQAD